MSASHRLFPVAIVAADWSLSYPVAKSRTVCAASKFGHQSVLNYRHLHHSWETASAVHASLLSYLSRRYTLKIMAQVSARMAAALARQGPKAAQLTKQVFNRIVNLVSTFPRAKVAITGHLVFLYLYVRTCFEEYWRQ